MKLILLVAITSLNSLVFGGDAPSHCRYSLSPISAQHTAEGGVYHLRLTASHPQCQWTFTPASWVHVNAKSPARGSMDLMYELQPNFFEQPRSTQLRLQTVRADGNPQPVATLTVRQLGRGQ